MTVWIGTSSFEDFIYTLLVYGNFPANQIVEYWMITIGIRDAVQLSQKLQNLTLDKATK